MTLTQSEFKKCNTCKQFKTIDSFSSNKSRKDGLSCRCKVCVNQHYLKNKEKIAEYKKQYRKDNAEFLKESKSKYYYENKEKINAKNKINWHTNKDKYLEQHREYYKLNKESIQSKNKEYRKTEIGKKVFKQARIKRKALIRKAKIGNINIDKLLENKNCYWCGVDTIDNYHIDHYVPISKGGTHSQDNLVLSCPSCNLKKGSKDPLLFALSIGKLF